MTRVLVCGGRDFDDGARLSTVLRNLNAERKIKVLIEGGARGADYLAQVWAHMNDIDVQTFEADWAAHGKAAGPIRNKLMLDEGKPDLVVAFPGGAGTRNMIRQALSAGVEVRNG